MKKLTAFIMFWSTFLSGLAFSAENSGLFSISVSEVENGKPLPIKFARNSVRGGKNISPCISWKNIPDGTKSFAVTCIDQHPIAGKWVHWMVLNIAPDLKEIPENASGDGKALGNALEMINSFGNEGYDGAQPPPGSGLHEYVFTVYALSVERLPVDKKKLSESDFLQLAKGKILAQSSVSALFGR